MNPSRDLARRLAVALGALAVVTLSSPARAQMGHGLPPPTRPLHQRLAQADVVAIAEVERVDLGRIALRDARVLRGAPAERFEVKRAPSRPLELAAGDHALFLLSGARPPYILVDEPRELLRLSEPAERERWQAALATLLAAGDDRDAVLAAYLGWVDGGDDALREAATRALTERRARDPLAIPPALAVQRARIALDPGRPGAVRRASAGIASVTPEGLAALLAGLARPDLDAGVAQVALASGGLQRAPGMPTATARALAHDEAEVRRSGLALAPLFARDPAVRSAVERVAKSDPDPDLRAEALRALRDAGVAAGH